jgi:hypothetical protein
LLLKHCVEDEVARPAIERALKDDTLLWLDLPDTSPDTLALPVRRSSESTPTGGLLRCTGCWTA